MKVVKTNIIWTFQNTVGGQAANDASNWLATTMAASWAGPNDVLVDFPNGVRNNNHWSFPLKPSGTVVEAVIRFKTPAGVVVIQKVT